MVCIACGCMDIDFEASPKESSKVFNFFPSLKIITAIDPSGFLAAVKKLKCGLLILSTITASSISYGEESDYLSTTNIQISYAKDADNDFITGYGSDGGKRIQYRFEHQSENSWGENYVFFDVVDLESPAGAAFGEGDTNTRENYGLWNTTLQMSKIFDTDLNFGIIKDIGLEGRFEHGSFFNYKSTAFGASLYLDVPYFQGKQDKFQLTWWRRSNCDDFVTGPFGSADGSCYDNHNFWGLTTRRCWHCLWAFPLLFLILVQPW